MLKSSPVLTSSASPSPTSIRYATTAYADTVPRPIPRRPSMRSAAGAMTSPSSLRSRTSDTVVDSTSTTDQRPVKTPRSQNPPQSTPPTTNAQRKAATPTATPPNPLSKTQQLAQPKSTLSPNKRRNSRSQDPSPNIPASEKAASVDDSPASSVAKRAKQQEKPPKALPQQYEFCAVEDVVELISHMLGELIATNDAIRISDGGLTRFHSRTAPGISVRDYLHRLARHATLTPPLLLAMVYYIDRLCAMYSEFTINTLTVHRFLITAATVAAKGLSDSFWNNTTYARVGGIRLNELSRLELEFLHRVDWKIVPNPEVLVAYYRGLVERAPGYTLEPDDSSEDDDVDAQSDEQEEGGAKADEAN